MEKQGSRKLVQRVRIARHGSMAAAMALAVLGACGSVDAFEIKTGSDDVVINWDNTLRYTLAQRLKGQSKDIANSPNHNDGDRNFDVAFLLQLLPDFGQTCFVTI